MTLNAHWKQVVFYSANNCARIENKVHRIMFERNEKEVGHAFSDTLLSAPVLVSVR